ncbi:MAG: LptF/LptG family permease, partial [Pyrinomonadaceae bacterium]
AGQSVYRLLLPCFLVMLLLGGLNWVIQERVLPEANQKQDAARAQLRNKGVAPSGAGKHWVATDQNIYSFYLAEESGASDNEKRLDGEPASANSPIASNAVPPGSASDNEKRVTCPGCVRDLTIYALGDKGQRLQTVYRSNAGSWESGKVNLRGNIERSELDEGKVTNSIVTRASIDEKDNPFTEVRRKPTHLDSKSLANQVATADAEIEQRSLAVALEKKQITLFVPLVMALFTAPFALSLSRKGKAATVGYAVALWLLFTGTSSVFEQLGLNASISPILAVWSPPAIFALIGLYLLSRVKT